MTLPASAGITSPKHLPERVRTILAEREEQSERLISWVQLALAGTLLTLFWLAPRPADAPMEMNEPVPVAIAAYTLFTLIRLLISYNRRLPRAMVFASIIADTALMVGLIWWFHVQYKQPPAFYLKVPTLTYLFILIALRALRFDWRYVLGAGLAAAAGWFFLVLYALSNSHPEIVTRSFTEYITGNRILIGAEFDKIFSILMVTAILAFAVYRARQTLVTAVREETATQDMRRFIPQDVADTITKADVEITPGTAAERDAAIVMLDIRGFTAFSRAVSPQQVVSTLTGIHARIVPIAEAHRGIVDKFLGDGIMLTFGAVQPSKTASADAVRALVDIMREAKSWTAEQVPPPGTKPLVLNGAVASGNVVFATLGSEDRLEYTVIGQAANLAAKLEKHNKHSGSCAIVPEDTWRAACEQGLSIATPPRKLEAEQVEGLAEPLTVYCID